jgi:predicted RNA-binding protein with PUA-like domain
MAMFLLKTEPETYSYDDLAREKRAVWDGVSNPAACKAIRSARKGDEAFIYHTGKEKQIVGLAQIASDPYEDPNAPGVNDRGEPKRPVFDLKPVKKATSPLTLAEMKGDSGFDGFELVRLPRLSVMAVPAKLEKAIRARTGL